ncbi:MULTISPECIES: LPXTG cell wall anchor domain-containing protein [unclassified Brevibacterium]|uniref:LPXTG cell wall anchor domain-containing protein n=1 Tax=unclassified Brevibacterium TaxID=2614124 RepID=UPI001F0D5A6C|nr:LPXTG cell wall anchor domain-containing protein [Brevibacterium sp. S22]
MKKLALAPAVAIAITGLAASPVIAAPEAPATAPSADTQPAKSPVQLQKGAAQDVTAQAGEIGVSADSVTVDEFAENGIGIGGAGLVADTEYKLTVEPTSGQNVSVYETSVTTDAEGAFDHAVEAVGEANPAFVGDYKVTVTNDSDENAPYSTSFKVTEGDTDEPEAPEVDSKISLNTDSISESDFAKNGIEVTGEGFTPGGTVNVVGGNAQSPFATKEVKADDEGKISTDLTFEGDSDLPAGDYAVWAVDQEAETRSEGQNFTITEDATEDPTTPAAEEAELTVSPETVSPADFVKEDKGVTLAVENCEPGEDVRFLVNPKGDSDVTAFDKTVKADDEGKANVNVYGTSASNASAYIGDYDVTVTCGDDELTGEFSVSEDANAGGSDGNEDGNGNDDGDNGDAGNGGDLPRTGTELTGLVGGAGLLLIGGVAVALTMRRKKAAQDPAEI